MSIAPTSSVVGKFMGELDVIVEGSQCFQSPSPISFNVPVMAATTFRLIADEHWSDHINLNYCEIKRKRRERVTCHVCEGGHHVHVAWPRNFPVQFLEDVEQGLADAAAGRWVEDAELDAFVQKE